MNPNLYEKHRGIYRLRDEIGLPEGRVLLLLQNTITGKVIEEEYKNLFVTVGRNAVANRLIGQDKGQITYCALGTGTNAPAAGNTTLQTEVFRKLIATREISSVGNNIASFTTFYNTGEANATLREAALFGDAATATADSGTLFARVAINRTKTSADTLTVYWTVAV